MTTAYTTGRLRLKPGTLGAPILETEAREVAKVLYHGGSDDAEAHANARRLLALWNAAEGIPTETLEAGVVVVPIPKCRHPKATLSAVGLMLLQQARAQEAVMSYDAATALRWAAKAIEAALSRLQQNGGADHD